MFGNLKGLIMHSLRLGIKDLLVFARDRMMLISFVVMPIFMMLMVGFIFPSQNVLKDVSFGVVNLDEGSMGDQIVLALQEMNRSQNERMFAITYLRSDVEAMADGSIAVCFINGAIRLSEQEEMVKLLRRKSQMVVAHGACSSMGGIPGLGNFWNKETIFRRSYLTTPSTDNAQGVVPLEKTMVDGKELHLPRFYDTVLALDQVIDVDYYLPGCAPPRDLILGAVMAILEGKLPPKGSVLSPNKSECDECDRNDSKPEKLEVKEIKRPWEVFLDPKVCFLAQGVICMGPATRTGCGQRCISANMPCRGCFGPTDQVLDQGAKFLSAFASILATNDEKEIDKIVQTIVDPAGTFYRFSLPHSILRRKRLEAVK